MNCQILNGDALSVIKATDTEHALFYLDPPYPETDQTFYKEKFNLDDFNSLIETLKSIKGKFILSFYERESIKIPAEWKIHKIPMRLLAGRSVESGQWRVELLATNF